MQYFSFVVWQASSNNYNQYLQIDLAERKLITSVATQGYRGSGQFVIDYHIEYSNDANTFTAIVNDLGESRVSICRFESCRTLYTSFIRCVNFIGFSWEHTR